MHIIKTKPFPLWIEPLRHWHAFLMNVFKKKKEFGCSVPGADPSEVSLWADIMQNDNNSRCEAALYLVDLLFRVCQQVGEVWEDVTVEDNLRLLVGPCHNVAHRPQSCRLQDTEIRLLLGWVWVITSKRTEGLKKKKASGSVTKTHLNFDLLVAKERHKKRNDSRIDDHLDLFISAVGQIWQSPHCVY